MRTPLASLLGFALLAGQPAHAKSIDANDIEARVEKIGHINGRALACEQTEIIHRTKSVMTQRVAKTRELGEIFERATHQAFLAQGKDAAGCPPQAALAIELDALVRPLSPPSPHQDSALKSGADAPAAGLNPRYLLQAANGRAIMDGDFPGKFQLISFGYTTCPDVCPTTLLEMSSILKQLGDDAALLQPIFISLDPERDTLAQLRAYLAYFDPRIIAATGTPELLRRAADNFKVRYEKIPSPGGNPQHYSIDHSAGMFLLSPGGQFLSKYPYGTPMADIVEALSAEIKRRGKRPGQ